METENIKKHKYSFEDRNAFAFCYVLLGIPLLFFLVFWVYINLDSILTAFKDPQGAWTFDNVIQVFKNFTVEDGYNVGTLGEILGRTVLLWFLVNIVCVIPSMLSSYVLYKGVWGANIFRVIMMIPSILAGIVWVMVMKSLVDYNGPVIAVLQELGVDLPSKVFKNGLLYHDKTAFTTIVLLNMFPHIVSFNLIISGAYTKIPADLFEVGRLEGLGFINEFFRVSVPLIWPTVVISLITNFATMFTFEGSVFLYTKGVNGTSTMGFYLYNLTFEISKDAGSPIYGYPAAVGLVMTVFTIPVVLFGKLFLEKLIEPVEY